MSRFFARDSDSESESSSSGEEEKFAPVQQRVAPTTRTYIWSDEEDDTKRVVKSEKDKRYEGLKAIIKNMKNHKNIKDMASVMTDFEELCKAYDKSKKVIEKEGVPKFYVKTLCELEDFINECWEDRDWRKTLNKTHARGLTMIRQRLRKYMRDFEQHVAKCRENPAEYEEHEESGSEDDDSDKDDQTNFLKASPAQAKKEKLPKLDDDDDSESDWEMSGSETSESDIEPATLTAAYFLKKTGDDDKEKKVKKVKSAAPKPAQKQVEEYSDDEEEKGEKWTTVGSTVVMIFPKDAEITLELVVKKLNEFTSNRGKKGTDRSQQIELLTELRQIATTHNLGVAMDCKMLFGIVGAIFDYNPNIATCMKGDIWSKLLVYMQESLTLLMEHRENLLIGSHVQEETENLEGDGPWRVRGSILTMMERLHEEYVKMLQACDAHSTEYVDRLKDEPMLCDLLRQLLEYMEDRSTTDETCRAYMKYIEHTYYKFVPVEKREASDKWDLDRLCQYIYTKDSTDRIRTRAMLCQIYHHAMHDRWYEARDLMLMSHLQDNIHLADITTQIMYNRAMVQLGLCAFRQGMTRDSHNCLVDIQSSGRAKELLAQGLLQRQHERTPEQEKIEKRRQMPYHMHINLELLECVYLVSAMLIEIPYMAAHEFDARRRMISKNFHYRMRESDRQPLIGPPESMREHVVAASKAMKTGDWSACQNFIINEKMNAKVWELFQCSEKVKGLLVDKIKEESLRTYLFSYSSVYSSLSLDTLSEMYELERARVSSIICKMIINEELAASMDEPSSCVIMHCTDPTRMQSLALQLSEKVSSLVDYNERLMEMKSGNFFFQRQYGDQQQGGYQQRNQGGYQQRDQQRGQGGYQQRDQQQGGYQKRGGGYQRGQGGYQQRDQQGGYQQRNQGGYQQRGQGGYQQREDEDRRQVRFQKETS